MNTRIQNASLAVEIAATIYSRALNQIQILDYNFFANRAIVAVLLSS